MNDVRPSGAHQTDGSSGSIAALGDEVRNEESSSLMWMLACCFCVGVLAVMAAHAPARVRLIGLFSVGFGLFVGWLTTRLAQLFEVRPARATIIMLAASLTLVGLVATTWQTFRLDELTQVKSSEEELAAKLMREFDRQQGIATPDLTPSSSLQRFRGYLTRRVRQLGRWPSPWPELFWCGECISAGIAAGWFAQRSLSDPTRRKLESGGAT